MTVENSECLRRGGRSAPFVVPLRRWHLTAEQGSLGGRSAFSFSRLNWRFAPSKTCGTLSPVEHATLFQSRQRFPSNLDDWVLGVVYHSWTQLIIVAEIRHNISFITPDILGYNAFFCLKMNSVLNILLYFFEQFQRFSLGFCLPWRSTTSVTPTNCGRIVKNSTFSKLQDYKML